MDPASLLGPSPVPQPNPAGVYADPDVTPLTEAPFALEPASQIERICWFIPLVGWTVAGTLERERRTPKWNYIADQLTLRTKRTAAAWGDDPLRRSLAATVSKVIR